jgi:hypothetical protein
MAYLLCRQSYQNLCIRQSLLFGLAVENLVFKTIKNRTVRRWGMQT